MHQYNQYFKTINIIVYKNDQYTLLILLISNIHKNVENFEIYVDHLKATLWMEVIFLG